MKEPCGGAQKNSALFIVSTQKILLQKGRILNDEAQKKLKVLEYQEKGLKTIIYFTTGFHD